MDKKRNIFIRFFKWIGRSIHNFFLRLEYCLIFIIFSPKAKCKIVGKQNVDTTEDKVFVANHYEIFGPIAMFLKFPFKFRPWVIDKMMDPKLVEEQMSLSVYNNFPKYPMWFKRFVIRAIRNLMVWTMNHAKAISVSRENPRENLKTLKESSQTLEKGTSILIFPEDRYVVEGVGKFQTGFENLAKYHYQKTGRILSFYPVFVSQSNKTIYIEKPIKFNPENSPKEEKERIIEHLYDSMLNSYIKNECGKPNPKAKKLK